MKPGDLRRWAGSSDGGFFLVIAESGDRVEILEGGSIYTFTRWELELLSVEAYDETR